MSAAASGASPNGDASTPKSRDHKQGNQERKYTIEQKTAVIRVRKCQATAFYEILALEKTASEGDIKKAYRKLSLLTHPDKNGYEGADEAFKMVSRAFQILSDGDKKAQYDRFGGDPDKRFNPGESAAGASPFGGFARSPGAGMGGAAFQDDISPEELFNRFFSGGGLGGSFGGNGFFDSGPGFVFNVGGGPGIRVHQFGGGRPRRRPQSANSTPEQASSGLTALTQLLPLLLLFILPLLSSLFSSSSTSAGPSLHFDTPYPPTHTMHRTTPKLKINYYIDPREVAEYSAKKFYNLDSRAEVEFVNEVRYQCRNEREHREQIIRDATGIFWSDDDRIREAYAMRLENCNRLEGLGLRVQQY